MELAFKCEGAEYVDAKAAVRYDAANHGGACLCWRPVLIITRWTPTSRNADVRENALSRLTNSMQKTIYRILLWANQ